MRASDLAGYDLLGLAVLLRTRQLSPVELTEACLERIQAVNPTINVFLTVTAELARREARTAEARIMRGDYLGPLHGIPYAAKDLLCTKGIRTSCASRILADFVPDFDATVVERLRAAGAILVGKTHLHEFAFGLTNLNPHYGPARNPWDPARITGGSSGGSAAAVAASCVPLALGSDTGGSIRIPAALCGVTGLKPTYGRVSKHGVFPLAWSLDHVGPLAKTAADAAAALAVLAGADPRDPACLAEPVPDYLAALEGDLAGMTIGVPEGLFYEVADPVVLALVRASAETFARLGAEVRPVAIPELETMTKACLVILSAEAASALGPFHRGHPRELGADVKARLDGAATHLASHYVDATRHRRRAQEHFAAAFREVDLLLTPTTSVPATILSETAVNLEGAEVPVGLALTRCTRIYNLLGLPAASLPCGLTPRGLPVGLQLAGPPLAEAVVLKAAHLYQRDGFRISAWPEPAGA